MPKLSNGYLAPLGIITAFCLLNLFVRNAVEGNTAYNFLLWNLFLAFVPLAVAWAALFAAGRWSKTTVAMLAGLWLAFYPNAPYMVSDMIHVNNTSGMVLYNALMLFMFAMLALFYGFCSLKIIHFVFRRYVGVKPAHTLVALSLLLSAAGIYLGRILRLNSWDLFTHPVATAKIIFNHLWPVTKNPTTYVVIFLFSAVQFMLLLMMKDMDEMEEGEESRKAKGGSLRLLRRKPVSDRQ